MVASCFHMCSSEPGEQSSWLEKENVTNPPIPLFSRWQGSRPGANALAGLRLFPGSHWLWEAIWLCLCPPGFCSEFLKGLLLSSISAAAGARGFCEAMFARPSGALSSPGCGQPPASGLQRRAGLEGPACFAAAATAPLWSSMAANREDSVLRTVWPWSCQPAAVTQLNTGSSL